MSTRKNEIVIYKDGFPDNLKDAMSARLAHYLKTVNHSAMESRKIGQEALQRIHEHAYQEFVRCPLYKFPEKSDLRARARYFQSCDGICDRHLLRVMS